jgi:hypothetical protein
MVVLCRGPEKNGMVRAGHGRDMASVNQPRPHCVNRMGKTHSKPLSTRHGRGMLCVNRPLYRSDWIRRSSLVRAGCTTIKLGWVMDTRVY